jgi:hypothetical protein
MDTMCTDFLARVWENWDQRPLFVNELRDHLDYWREDVSMSGGHPGEVPSHCEVFIELCDRYLSTDDETTFWRIIRVAQATEPFGIGGLVPRSDPMRAEHERWLQCVIDDCRAGIRSERLAIHRD